MLRSGSEARLGESRAGARARARFGSVESRVRTKP